MSETNRHAPRGPSPGRGDIGSPGRASVAPTLPRIALAWFAGGLFAVPIAILPHEVGHYLVLLALGVPDLALHHMAVTWDLQEFWESVLREDHATAAGVAPIWGVALSDAAGPLVTYGLVAACCYGCAYWRAHPLLVAVGYVSQLRIWPGARHVFRNMVGIESSANYDELRVSILTGIPVQVLVGFALAVLVVTGIWLARSFPRERRVAAPASMVLGTAAGVFIYARYVGPWLLP